MSSKKPDNEPEPTEAPEPADAEIDAQADAGQDAPVDVDALSAERDDLLARLQRVSADYLNFQKRQERQLAEARELANAGLAHDVLAVLDDMERAMDAALANHDEDDPLLAGMRLVYDKALVALAGHGVSPMPVSAGDPFDPQRHEAMMRQPGDVETPTIAQELQRGYELHGRVLRPARVVVAVPAEVDGAKTEDEDGDDADQE